MRPMLRPMVRPVVASTAVTAALILLAGCGGDDNKASGSDDNGGDSASATPTAPAVPTFDPPKAFKPAAAYPAFEEKGRSTLDESQVSIAGQVALIGSWSGLSGHDVADPTHSWTIPSKTAETTTVYDAAKPMAVTVDGKDVAVAAYAEADKGNGTQKPSGLVVIQWIDVMSGKKIAEVSTKVSTLEDTGDSGIPNIKSQAYDPETGQVAIGVTTAGKVMTRGTVQTVYADPKTQKSTVVADMQAAAVHDGVVAGAKGTQEASATDATVLLVDGASGKVTKQVPLKQAYLNPLAGGAKHAYFYGMVYTDYDQGTKTEGIFAVDLSTGAVVKTVPTIPLESDSTVNCLTDGATSVVCTTTTISHGPQEIFGFDDATGKKTWGFTAKSGNRVVPEVSAAFHGVLYAQTEAQPVLLDAKTGQDLPSGATSGSPSSSDSPSADSGNESPGNGDLGLFNGTMASPDAVSTHGAVYRQSPIRDDYSTTREIESVCIYLAPIA